MYKKLFRRGMETYYFKNRNECDFIVKKGRTPTHAIQVNIQIMRSFFKLRRLIAGVDDLKSGLEKLKDQTDQRFQIVFETIKQLLETDAKPKKIYPVKSIFAMNA